MARPSLHGFRAVGVSFTRFVGAETMKSPTRRQADASAASGRDRLRQPDESLLVASAPMNQVSGPLAGLVVADFSRVLAGPYCTMILGDLGADVIKVEGPGGDDTRHWVPPVREGISTYYLSINRNIGRRSA